MKVKYRPHRGSLDKSMSEAKEFNSIDEMRDFLVSDWNGMGFGEIFTKDDIVVCDDRGKDERIDWKECRYVLVSRMGAIRYCPVQCIGYCSIEE